MKKILTALLSLALIMNMAACGDYAPNELEYPYILEDGVLTISVNTDEMEIFYESREMWIDQIHEIHTVILDDSVRSIGKDAFQDYPNLKRIIFNDRVDDIGPGAFAGTGLILEELPDSLRYIGEEAFAGCTVPETLVIPKNVRKIEQGAFVNVKGLKTLVLLGHTEVAQNTHNETGPNSVFENTGLSQVILPENYQGTHYSAFGNCTNLTKVDLKNSPNNVPAHAFENCVYLTDVILSKSTYGIMSNTFSGCTSLTNVTFQAVPRAIEAQAFAGCTSLKSLTLPEGTAYIDSKAFQGCTALEEIIIPTTVEWIVYDAFQGCTKLSRITVAEGNTVYSQHESGLIYDSTNTILLIIPPAFSGRLYIPEGTQALEICEFSSTAINELVLPNTVTTIKPAQFRNSSLESIWLPDSLLTMGNDLFENCENLQFIHYAGTQAQWDAIEGSAAVTEKWGHLLVFESPAPTE